MNRLEGKD